MEPQWNPMLEDQALDRVYRIGQKKEVTTTRYIVANTLEQAFAMSRGHDKWLEVSHPVDLTSGILLIDMVRTSQQCSREFLDFGKHLAMPHGRYV